MRSRCLFIVPLVLGLCVFLPTMAAASAEPAEPESVDLRPEFERWKLSPRPQGGRSTCSVFAITGAIEYALAEKQQRGTRLSVEFLNWASNRAIERQADGGFFSDLWKGFESHGICEEDEMPYAKAFEPSRRPSNEAMERARQIQEAGFQLHWIKPWNPRKGLSEQQFLDVKETLRKGWPVCGGFLWPKNAKWSDGVLQMASRQGVYDGHSLLLVGFRDDPQQPGGGVFLMHNSSGGSSDGAMSYEYAQAYMNDAVWIDYDAAKLPSVSKDRPISFLDD